MDQEFSCSQLLGELYDRIKQQKELLDDNERILKKKDLECEKLTATAKAQRQQLLWLRTELQGTNNQGTKLLSERAKQEKVLKYLKNKNRDLLLRLNAEQMLREKILQEKVETAVKQECYLLTRQNDKLQQYCEKMAVQVKNLTAEKASAEQKVLKLQETLIISEVAHEKTKTTLNDTKAQLIQCMEQVAELKIVKIKAETLQTIVETLEGKNENQKVAGLHLRERGNALAKASKELKKKVDTSRA